MKWRIFLSILANVVLAGLASAQAPPLFPTADDNQSHSLPPLSPIDVPESINHEIIPPAPPRLRPFTWLSVDYTVGALSSSQFPALVTTSPFGVAQVDAGVAGRPFTSVLLGQGSFSTGAYHGMRFGAGINPFDGVTFEFNGFFLLTTPATFRAGSDEGNAAPVARPFFEPITGDEAAQLVAFPGRFVGTIDARMRTSLWGFDIGAFEEWNLGIPISPGISVRYADLSESLSMQQTTTALGVPALTFNGLPIPLSDSVRINDSFQTHNQFIGPQMELRCRHAIGPMYFGVAAKLAMGSTQQTIKILGSSDQLAVDGATVRSTAAGFLATATNIGTHTRSVFSVMPELNLKLGYNISSNCNVYVGYDFLAWTGVARPGEQIDRSVNLTRVPSAAIFDPNFGGPANPAPLFRSTDLYVHAFRVGVEWRY